MAKKKRLSQKLLRRRRKRLVKISVWMLVLAVLFSVAFYFREEICDILGIRTGYADPVTEGSVEFHFFDVGQGDAAVIRTTKGVVLIDTSLDKYEDELKAYLDALGVESIAFAVFTHPDADHIGGADMIMEEYDVEHVILSGYENDTPTYRSMMDAIDESGAKVTVPDVGDVFELGELRMEVLAPLDDYDDANESSIVIRADYGETSVLFTGDAESGSEADMVKKYLINGKLDCDLLKVGHHGSTSSSTEKFLDAVTPDYAVISCGENSYGHPKQEVLDRLEDVGAEVYRTDKKGTVVFVSDGDTLKIQ